MKKTIDELTRTITWLTESQLGHNLNWVLIPRAMKFAKKRHAGQKRKEETPYEMHVLEVGLDVLIYLLSKRYPARDVIDATVAAILHDVWEDTDTSLEEIEQHFDRRVAQLVEAVSHPKKNGVVDDDEPDSEYLGRVAIGGGLAILIKRFDILHNARSSVFAPIEFRRQKVADYYSRLPWFEKHDPQGAELLAELLATIPLS